MATHKLHFHLLILRDYLDYLISFERGIIPSPVILVSILSLNKLF